MEEEIINLKENYVEWDIKSNPQQFTCEIVKSLNMNSPDHNIIISNSIFVQRKLNKYIRIKF